MGTRRRASARTGCLLMTAAFALVLPPGTAVAGQYNNSWDSNAVTGYCGGQTGGYVVAIQQMERSRGTNTTPIDN